MRPGSPEKGDRSAGVQRQDKRQATGTAGKKENCQVAVFLAYAAPDGVALIDRDLYLPAGWTDDRARCTAAGIGQDVGFKTKPQLAQAMLERALAAGVPFGWVTGDTVYGGDRHLRMWLEQHAIPHVMAAGVHRTGVGGHRPWTWAGGCRAGDRPGARRAVATPERRRRQQGQAAV
jgi:SRSO17 transposase